MSVDLSRARIVELKHRLDDWETVALRYELGGSWELAGDIKRWTDDELHVTFKVFQVLAEFPVTLADLLPEGCTRFEFKDEYGHWWVFRNISDNGDSYWTPAGPNTPLCKDLREVEEAYRPDLSTVVPLQAHPQYVEERR